MSDENEFHITQTLKRRIVKDCRRSYSRIKSIKLKSDDAQQLM
jgi:hypothetical protein